MITEFYIDAELGRGLTPVHVEPVSCDQWDLPACPQFELSFFNETQICTLIVQLENGTWYDRRVRLGENSGFLCLFNNATDEIRDPDYRSPLHAAELQQIGAAISQHMSTQLKIWLNLFVPPYPAPVLN
ncbi:hypothetical protein FO440_14895 [Mucilaginibacter corticis]|uniref:Uncharacterized protein n=1 Tax=Mucilaginibacter corticis TaxID=2597670 RepID=A0A556MMD3_9SPHI|nr:hypothetical protein [Mucilaginibacter corticis]TSJ41018.1 hypothetical protein FO440_14895 [Mucilaginibacter corticis]